MEHPWLDFWNRMGDTIGIAAAFCFGGAAFLLWVSPDQHSPRNGLTVIIGGQILCAATTAFVHGYLGANIFVAPLIGLGCGLVAVPVLMAVIKLGQEKAGDWIEALVRRITGSQETKP